MTPNKFVALSLTLLASTLVLASCGFGPPPGMRLFQVEYRVDSKLVFVALYDESDSVPVPKLWESLTDAPGRISGEDSAIKPDPVEPLRVSLNGNVEVRIVHAGTLLSSSKVESLTLSRDTTEDSLWYPASGELSKLTGSATY